MCVELIKDQKDVFSPFRDLVRLFVFNTNDPNLVRLFMVCSVVTLSITYSMKQITIWRQYGHCKSKHKKMKTVNDFETLDPKRQVANHLPSQTIEYRQTIKYCM